MKKISQKPTSKPMKIGKDTGSLTNWIMSGSHRAPVVGEGATEIMWSDRHAYEVLKVSEDYKEVVIRRYKAERIDNNGMSECQEYAYKEFEGPEIELKWLWGAYRVKHWNPNYDKVNQCWKDDVVDAMYMHYGEDVAKQHMAEWKKYTWEKINIVFGMKEEYYDFSF